jgi:hypothetical protein
VQYVIARRQDRLFAAQDALDGHQFDSVSAQIFEEPRVVLQPPGTVLGIEHNVHHNQFGQTDAVMDRGDLG